MTTPMQKEPERVYAVTVRDGADLFLLFDIRRKPAGDVYVNNPRDDPRWKAHTSYHASGQTHHKSFGHKAVVRHLQKPGANFVGTENVVTQGIASDEARTNTPVRAADYDDVFEIQIADLRPEMYRTALSVDLTDGEAKPTITVGARVLRQRVFADAVPLIVVTLFETT